MSRSTPDPATSFDELPDLQMSVALIRRYQDGDDEKALGELLDRYQGRIRRIARQELGQHLRQHLDSLDIRQEVNMVAMRKLKSLEVRSHSSLLRWFTRIVVNQVTDAHDRLTANKRDMRRNVPLEARAPGARGDGDSQVGFVPSARGPRPDEQAEAAELRRVFDEALDDLSPDHRRILLLRNYYEADWREIAAELGRSVEAVQQLHLRAQLKWSQAVSRRLPKGV